MRFMVESATRDCGSCGKAFVPAKRWQAYCTTKCRMAHHNGLRPVKRGHRVVFGPVEGGIQLSSTAVST